MSTTPKPAKRPATGFRRKVASPRNSILGSGRWECLDWANWWTDSWNTDSGRYLHVEHLDKEDGRVSRVYPRKHEGRTVTLNCVNGELYWSYNGTAAEWAAWGAWMNHRAAADRAAT